MPVIGVPGYLAMLAGSIGLAMLVSPWILLVMAVLGIAATAWCAPRAFRPLVRTRWILLSAVLILPSIFLAGPLDRQLLGVGYSSQGLAIALPAILRMVVIFLSMSLFTSFVEISALAGILERIGLQGLGFSLGVALNLLPSLQHSALTTWRVLRMRGGLRRQRVNALRLMTITVISQALGRAEEIAWAAEVRAFTPEKARAYPVVRGSADGVILWGSALVMVVTLIAHFV